MFSGVVLLWKFSSFRFSRLKCRFPLVPKICISKLFFLPVATREVSRLAIVPDFRKSVAHMASSTVTGCRVFLFGRCFVKVFRVAVVSRIGSFSR